MTASPPPAASASPPTHPFSLTLTTTQHTAHRTHELGYTKYRRECWRSLLRHTRGWSACMSG